MCFKVWKSPMTEDYFPELETTLVLEGSEVAKYHMFIGFLNWIITLGRIDIKYTTFYTSQVYYMPKDGTLSGSPQSCGYLKKYSKARIDVDTSYPTPQREAVKYDWIEFQQGM